MSSDSGPRKRNKDKKRKKGNTRFKPSHSHTTRILRHNYKFPSYVAFSGGTSDPVPNLSVQREAPVVKLVMDETIHVQKDADFGGNICSKVVFTVLILLIGAALLIALSDGKYSEGTVNCRLFVYKVTIAVVDGCIPTPLPKKFCLVWPDQLRQKNDLTTESK